MSSFTVCLQNNNMLFLLLGSNDSPRRAEERRRSSDFIIPKQMVQNEGRERGCDLRVANLTLDLP